MKMPTDGRSRLARDLSPLQPKVKILPVRAVEEEADSVIGDVACSSLKDSRLDADFAWLDLVKEGEDGLVLIRGVYLPL